MDILRYLQAYVNVRSERGSAVVEYALLLALIVVVCIVAVGTVDSEASIGSSLR